MEAATNGWRRGKPLSPTHTHSRLASCPPASSALRVRLRLQLHRLHRNRAPAVRDLPLQLAVLRLARWWAWSPSSPPSVGPASTCVGSCAVRHWLQNSHGEFSQLLSFHCS
ncbi:hypothetical protein ACQJBY_004100 [Aegilops geniculata]